MSINYQALLDCAKLDRNVMLIGPHGCGKTFVTFQVMKELGLKIKYYSSATLDPWADLVGVPIPIDKVPSKETLAKADLESVPGPTKELMFIRPRSVDDAEIIFFDELNRAHPKVLNAVMEITQLHSINGEKLPKLKMVWSAINPPGGDYKVVDLDPALVDRFHVFFEILPDPSIDYLAEACGDRYIAETVVKWWHGLEAKTRSAFSPRRLEYICTAAKTVIPLQCYVPHGIKAPISSLENQLRGKKPITIDSFKEEKTKAEILKRLQSNDMETQVGVVRAMQELKFPQVVMLWQVLAALSKEGRAQVFSSETTGSRLRDYIGQYFKQPRAGVIRPEVQKVLDMWDEFEASRKKA